MYFSDKKLGILVTIDKSFDVGTRENYILNLVLLRFLQIYKVYKVYKLNQDKYSYHVKEMEA